MELIETFLGIGITWSIALLTGIFLFRRHRERKNPLDWSIVDRCLLLIVIYFFIVGSVDLVDLIEKLFFRGSLSYLNPNFFEPFQKITIFDGLVWIFLWMTGLWLRGRAPASLLYAYAVVQFSAFDNALFCYLFGAVTHPGALLFGMAQGTFTIILFPLSVALPWIITFIVILVGFMILSSFEIIPYAPVFAEIPFIDGKIAGAYWTTTLAWSIMALLLMLSLIAFIVIRWRDREAKLADMTAILKKMFGRYLSTEVMKSLIENPSALELGGERREVTIMMTDLRGFTALSERLEPEQVVQMLNAYFEVMVEVILKYNGTINEIIGDALLVIFGAPQEMSDRTQRAIACAIEMQNAMAEVNDRNRGSGLPELEMGIGLNETEVIVGNIGSSKRSKYAVVGSGVNMTSRIESYTVGGQILISESVRKKTGEVLRIDTQREVLPKGTETPLRIYEVGGIAGRYNMVLEGKATTLVTLVRQIPLRYTVLEAKDVGKKKLEGSVVRLFKKPWGRRLHLRAPLEILTKPQDELGQCG